ncbi:MAG: DUF2169 domain-containing protein [Deltaproteobacteria bacterium]|nr:DUF2169 domain-containing protein [Deltaproteobacteria bacterium]
MKVIKPQRLSVLQRVVEHRRQCSLVVSVIAYVPFDAPRRLLVEQALWKDVAEVVPGGVADECYPKGRGEILVSGSAYAPEKQATAAVCELSLMRRGKPLVGKRLAVWGNRYWVGNERTEPTPFESMPVDWAHAYGGVGFAKNPLGKGFVALETEHGVVHPLPNVERQDAMLLDRDDHPEPAGFGTYDVSWPQRFAHLGTQYDAAWLKTLFPAPAEDFDWSFYNAAPADQQIEGFFEGDEVVTISGMHPSRRRVELTVPRMVVRVMVTQRGPEGTAFRPFAARLDTIHVMPHLERAMLIYRCALPVAEDDADDIEHLLVAAEDPDHPRPVEHYEGVLATRLDKQRGALASMRDADLMPPESEGWASLPDPGDMAEMSRVENRRLAKVDRARKQKLAEVRAELEKAGFGTGDVAEEAVRPELDFNDFDAVEKLVVEMSAKADTMRAEAAQAQSAAEVDARQSFALAGMNYDEEMAAATAAAGGPPTFSADEQLVMLHDMARIAREGDAPIRDLERDLTDPEFERMLRELEARVRDGYMKFAHVMPAAPRPNEAERQLGRTRTVAAKDAGESLAGRNLVGADLHGLDLRGVNLAGAALEGADLSGADLSDADLSGAVLARANLEDCRLVGANLTGANLGATRLKNTDLSSAVLDATVLAKSELDGAVLHGASLRDTDFIEVTFTRADFSHAVAHQPLFVQSDLRNVCFVGAKLEEARFLNTDVRGVDFTSCALGRAQFLQTQGDRANFSGADLQNSAFTYESSFADASFAGADLRTANFQKTPLARACFDDARLDGASLIGCDAQGASFVGASAREGLFIRTDFRKADLRRADMLSALLQKARLEGANLTGANLSRADISLSRSDRQTRFDEALMLETRVDPRYVEPKAPRGPDGPR